MSMWWLVYSLLSFFPNVFATGKKMLLQIEMPFRFAVAWYWSFNKWILFSAVVVHFNCCELMRHRSIQLMCFTRAETSRAEKKTFTRNNKNKFIRCALIWWKKHIYPFNDKQRTVQATYEFLMGTNSFPHDNMMLPLSIIPFIHNQFLCNHPIAMQPWQRISLG